MNPELKILTSAQKEAEARKLMEAEFLSMAYSGISGSAFLTMLGLQGAEAMVKAASAANSEGVPVNVTQRMMHVIGGAIGYALLGVAPYDEVSVRRFREALADGFSDAARRSAEEAEPFTQAMHVEASSRYSEFSAYQQQKVESSRKPQLYVPPSKVVTL